MGADGAAKGGEARRQIIGRPPADANTRTIRAAEGLAPGAAKGFTAMNHETRKARIGTKVGLREWT